MQCKGCDGECPRHSCKCPGHITSDPDAEELQAIFCSGTETTNNPFKHWGVLKQCFGVFNVGKHAKAFCSVAIHVQFAIENGEPLFALECIDPHLMDVVHVEHNEDAEETKSESASVRKRNRS